MTNFACFILIFLIYHLDFIALWFFVHVLPACLAIFLESSNIFCLLPLRNFPTKLTVIIFFFFYFGCLHHLSIKRCWHRTALCILFNWVSALILIFFRIVKSFIIIVINPFVIICLFWEFDIGCRAVFPVFLTVLVLLWCKVRSYWTLWFRFG